jgi:hypothetical protein
MERLNLAFDAGTSTKRKKNKKQVMIWFLTMQIHSGENGGGKTVRSTGYRQHGSAR